MPVEATRLRTISYRFVLFALLALICAPALYANPNITAVAAANVSSSAATINWITDVAGDSQVNYGPTSSYGSSSALDTNLVTSHGVTLQNLNPATTYHFQVASRDGGGNLSTLADFTFRTANTQAGIPIANGTWNMVLTQGIPEQSNDWEQLVYASVVQNSIMLSQYHQSNTEPNETLLGYNFDTNSWTIFDMGGLFHTENMPEGGESIGYVGYNPSNSTLLYHCCVSGSNQAENVNHTWWYDLLGQSGRDEHTSPEPPFLALQPGGAFDVASNVFVVEGGASFVGTWLYQPDLNAWNALTTNGTPPDPSLILPGVAYDNSDRRVYLFGGKVGTTYSSSLYAYDVPTNTWSLISPASALPPARYRMNFAYDSTNNIFLLYGGQNAGGVLNDTWVFDPTANAWTQLNPAESPPVNAASDFSRLSYDSDHNVFVLSHRGKGGYFGGNWQTLAMQTWLFRYAGTGPYPGTNATHVQAAPGSINRNVASWAKDPAIAATSSQIYTVWSETGSPFDNTSIAWPHIYADVSSGGSWSPLGSSFTAISTSSGEAHSPSISVSGGTPWVSWYQSTTTSGGAVQIYAANWDGSVWQPSAIGFVNNSSAQGRSQLVDVGGVPYMGFIEVTRSVYPQAAYGYVKNWNGTSWNLLGSAPLNRHIGAGSTASSLSIASDGSVPYVAWTEYVRHDAQAGDVATVPQVYVSSWNGGSWLPLGGSLNINSSDWAYDASVACFKGQPYVAWVERSQTGNALLYVATWNGTSWTVVGSGTLNQNPVTGFAFHPSLVADNSNNVLYVGWIEQSALGQKAQAYVSRYASGVWTNLGGSLNADTINGSAQHMTVAVSNGAPVAAWGEVNFGSLRNIYVKQWNGSSWSQISGNGGGTDTSAPTVPSSLSGAAASADQINLSWTGSNDNVGVAGYYVYRDGNQIANVTTTQSFSDTNLSPYTSYSYTVAAYDAAGNVSPMSAAANVRTAAPTPVGLLSVNLSPATVVGGNSTTSNTVSLDGPASGGGAVVTLQSSDPSVTLPASVTVAAGSSVSPTFTVNTSSVTSNLTVAISATYNGITVSSNLLVTTGTTAQLQSVNLSPTSVVGGNSTTANTVTLTAAAPTGGAVVALSSNNPAAQVPSSVTVPAGSSVSPPFTITTSTVTSTQTATISATYNGINRTGSLTINPQGTANLASVSLSPTVVVGGNPTNGNNTVSLTEPAPTGGAVVTLSSSDPSVTVPASVTVSAGATKSAPFTVTTNPVSSNLSVTISGTYNGVTKNAGLTVVPPSISLVGLSPATVVGGGSTTKNYVKLNGPAPNGGAVVTLSSSNPDATVPASVTIAAGATTSPTFTITTNFVSSNETSTISGTYNGGSKSSTMNINPVALSSIMLAPPSTTGGVSTTNNKVNLNGAASPSGVLVTLSSSDPSVGVPSSITVPAGATVSPTFTITTTPVSSTLSATISATYNGTTKTATLTVNPPLLTVLALSPTSVVGGSPTTTNYVKLNAAAPAGGVVVTLSSNNPSAVASASVTVPGGAMFSPYFTITTTAVTSIQEATISASYNGTTKTGTLTIDP